MCMVLVVLVVAMLPSPPPPLFLPVFLLNVLSKALALLHSRGIVEPKLLLQSACFVRASAACVSCLLLASAAEAPSLSVMFSPGYLFEVKCPPNCRHLNGGNGSGSLIHNGSSRHANSLLILDEFISNPPVNIASVKGRCAVAVDEHTTRESLLNSQP